MNEKEPTTLDVLMSPLSETLEALEKSRTIHSRETLSLTNFVRLVVYYFVSSLESGRQLVTDTKSADEELDLLNVKKSTFFDAFSRFPVKWFALMLSAVLGSFAWQTVPELAALGQLYLIDGSIFPGLRTMCWANYKKNCPAIKLHLCFDLNRMLPVNFLVGEGNSNERDALRQMLEKRATYIADRGYVCFKLLADIVAEQAHFIIRMRDNLDYTRIESLPVSLPDSLSHFFSNVTDQKVQLNGADGKPEYRLVTFNVVQEQYLILTDRFDLTTLQIIMLYAYRWQVELIFRFLKHSMHGLHLLSTSTQGVTIQFYLLLISALLELRLKQECVSQVEMSQKSDNTECPPDSALTPVRHSSLLPQESTALSNREKVEQSFSQRMAASSSSRGQTFMNTIGDKLHRYWKISIHWIIHLRNRLAKPFSQQTIELLGT